MKKLYEKSEIIFAILWIVIYTVGVGTLKSNFGLNSLWQTLALIVLSVAMFRKACKDAGDQPGRLAEGTCARSPETMNDVCP